MKYEVPKFVEDYLEYVQYTRRKSSNTVKSYNHDLHMFFEFVKKIKNTEKITLEVFKTITKAEIEQYIRSMSEKSKATVNRRIAAIQGLYKKLYKDKIINDNVSEDIAWAVLDERIPTYLTEGEVEKFEKNIIVNGNARDLAIVTLIINCGLRASEIVKLNLTDIRDNSIHIANSKGGKSRTLYIDDKVKETLDQWLKERPSCDTKAVFLVAYKSENPRRITYTAVHDLVSKYAKQIAKDEIHTHSLRHTCGILLMKDGIPIRVIQRILGHKEITTTQIYTYVSDQDVETAMTRKNK